MPEFGRDLAVAALDLAHRRDAAVLEWLLTVLEENQSLGATPAPPAVTMDHCLQTRIVRLRRRLHPGDGSIIAEMFRDFCVPGHAADPEMPADLRARMGRAVERLEESIGHMANAINDAAAAL